MGAKTEPNMLVMYQSPCFIFRDIFFCSSEVVSNSLARGSYWLVGWDLHSGGALARALDQNKANPLEEVTCVALRRGLLLCGTEGGRILGFQCSDRDSLGRSKVELVFDVFKKPTIKIPASKKRILALDLGFKGGFLYIFYRVDPD